MLHKTHSEMWWPFVVSHYFWVTAKKLRRHCVLTEQTAETVSANFSHSLTLVMWYRSISLWNTEGFEFLLSQMYFTNENWYLNSNFHISSYSRKHEIKIDRIPVQLNIATVPQPMVWVWGGANSSFNQWQKGVVWKPNFCSSIWWR